MTRKKDSTKSPFVELDGVYIRKTTALYILQENPQLSNDRLLRVCSAQPLHLFSGAEGIVSSPSSGYQETVFSGDLCVFQHVDNEKHLVGRVIQLSYLEGSKKSREYSSSYVETTKDSMNCIGVLANWYQGVSSTLTNSAVLFKPLDSQYNIGYLSMEYYKYTIDESSLQESDSSIDRFSFSILENHLSAADEYWRDSLSFDYDFEVVDNE